MNTEALFALLAPHMSDQRRLDAYREMGIVGATRVARGVQILTEDNRVTSVCHSVIGSQVDASLTVNGRPVLPRRSGRVVSEHTTVQVHFREGQPSWQASEGKGVIDFELLDSGLCIPRDAIYDPETGTQSGAHIGILTI